MDPSSIGDGYEYKPALGVPFGVMMIRIMIRYGHRLQWKQATELCDALPEPDPVIWLSARFWR